MPGWHHPVFASRHILDHKNAKTFCVDPITRFGGALPDYIDKIQHLLEKTRILLTLKTDPFFARGCSKTMFMGF